MPYVQRPAGLFLALTAFAIFVLIALMIVLMTRPARASDQIPCWKARALLAYAGKPADAEKLAERNGYTKTQIAEVRRRCGL